MRTNLVCWASDAHWIYCPSTPFTGVEGDSITITGGVGWAPGVYAVNYSSPGPYLDSYNTTADGPQNMVRLVSAPAAAGVTGGIGDWSPPPDFTARLVADGNSQTAGAAGTSWATLISAYLPAGWSRSNIAVSGQTTQDMTADATSQVVPLLSASNDYNVVVAQEVMNDIFFGATGVQAYSHLAAYSAIVRGVNGSKLVVVCPQPTRGDFSGGSTGAAGLAYTAAVLDFMALFLSGWPDICDAWYFPGQDARLADCNNATYYNSGDLVHWLTAGEAIVARGVAEAVAQVLPSGVVDIGGTAAAPSGAGINGSEILGIL